MEYNVNMSPILDERLSSFEIILSRLETKISSLEGTILQLNNKLDNLEKGSDEINHILHKNRELYVGLMNNIKETESEDTKHLLQQLQKNNEILLEQLLINNSKRRENLYWRYSGVGIVHNILQLQNKDFIKKP